MLSKLFILNDRCAPVPCADEKAWEQWMSVADHVQIMTTKVATSRCTVVTEFLGSDQGCDGHVVFFDTWIDLAPIGRINIIRDPASAERTLYASSPDWTTAMVQHDRAISFARRMAL